MPNLKLSYAKAMETDANVSKFRTRLLAERTEQNQKEVKKRQQMAMWAIQTCDQTTQSHTFAADAL